MCKRPHTLLVGAEVGMKQGAGSLQASTLKCKAPRTGDSRFELYNRTMLSCQGKMIEQVWFNSCGLSCHL